MSGARRPVADIYIRESNIQQLDAYSPEQMVDDCRRKITELGADVGRVVVEDGKRDEWDCPELQEEIRRARAGLIDHLVSWDTARLSGDLAKHLWLKQELKDTRVAIHYATVDFAPTDEGALHEDLLGLFNRYERAKIRARTQNGIKGKLARGYPVGNGVLPYGLERVYDARERTIGYAPRAGQVEVLQRIVGALAEQTMQDVCDDLNDEGVPTPSGRGRWGTGIISRLLANTTYTGDYRFGAVRKIPGRRPDGRRIYREQRNDASSITTFAIGAIVSPAAMAAAKQGLARRKRARRTGASEGDDPYALRGRLTCGSCGGALSIAVNNGHRRYLCLRAYGRDVTPETRCPLPEVPAEALEAVAWAELVARLSDREKLEQAIVIASDGGEQARSHECQVESVRAEMDKLERRIANAADVMLDFGKGTVQYDHARAASIEAGRTAGELTASLAELQARRPNVLTTSEADRMRAAWEELTVGIGEAGSRPATQRLLYRLVDLTGTVVKTAGEDGVRLGRKHLFRLEWRMRLRLSGSAPDPSGYVLLWDSQAAGPRVAVGDSAAA